MRSRLVVLAAAAVASVAALAPSVAGASPAHNNGMTINATPNPIIAGQGVLIYGQVNGANSADQPVVLYHRIAPHYYFSVISRTVTNSLGFYEFVRPEGIVDTNRQWFVVDPSNHAHSRTISESVLSLIHI